MNKSTKSVKSALEFKASQYTQAVLITGASSGIGLAFTEDFLSQHNYEGVKYETVIMVASNQEKLKKIVVKLKEKYRSGPKILTFVANLSHSDAVTQVRNFIKKNRLRVVILINNAGVGYMGDFVDMSEKKIGEIITLNITALTGLSHMVLKHIHNWDRKPKANPIIINVASVVGIIPVPLSTVYAASKAYVVSFSEALRTECMKNVRDQGYKVEVYTLCPGSTRTSFFDKAGENQRGFIATDHFMDPTQVVKETREAVNRKQGFIIPGTTNRLIPLFNRILPRRLVIKISYWLMKRRLR